MIYQGDMPKYPPNSFRAGPLQAMIADIYRTRSAKTFLLVPRGAQLHGVPRHILDGLRPALFFKTRDLTEPLLSIDITRSMSDLRAQGFSVCQI